MNKKRYNYVVLTSGFEERNCALLFFLVFGDKWLIIIGL